MALTDRLKRLSGHSSAADGQRKYAYVLSLAVSFLFFSFVARFGYGVLVPRMIE